MFHLQSRQIHHRNRLVHTVDDQEFRSIIGDSHASWLAPYGDVSKKRAGERIKHHHGATIRRSLKMQAVGAGANRIILELEDTQGCGGCIDEASRGVRAVGDADSCRVARIGQSGRGKGEDDFPRSRIHRRRHPCRVRCHLQSAEIERRASGRDWNWDIRVVEAGRYGHIHLIGAQREWLSHERRCSEGETDEDRYER